MDIKLFDLLNSVSFDVLVFGSDFVDDEITFFIADYDYNYTKFSDYFHRNGWSDCVLHDFRIFNDGLNCLCIWVKEWTV